MRWGLAMVVVAAGCGAASPRVAANDPCAALRALGAGDAAPTIAALRAAPTCPAEVDAALARIAAAASLDEQVLRAFVHASAADRADAEHALWEARRELASGAAAAAATRLTTAAEAAPSPPLLAELARARRVAGLDDDARALADAQALAAWLTPGPVVTRILDAPRGVVSPSPDHLRWATVGAGVVVVHDGITGQPVHTLVVDGVERAAPLDDGRVVVATLREVSLRELAGAATPLATVEEYVAPALAVSPDGATVAVVLSQEVRLLSLVEGSVGEQLGSTPRTGEAVRRVEWRGSSLMVVSGDLDRLGPGELAVWRVEQGALQPWSGTPRVANDGALRADGERVAVMSEDAVEVIAADGAVIEQAPHPDWLYGGAIGFGGDLAVVAGEYGSAGQLDHGRIAELSASVPLEGWAPMDGDRIWARGGGVVELAPDGDGPPVVVQQPSPGAGIEGLAWSGSGDQLIIGAGGDLAVVARGEVRRSSRAGLAGLSAIRFRPGTTELWWATSWDAGNALIRWDPTPSEGDPAGVAGGHAITVQGTAEAFGLSSDGSLVVLQPGYSTDLEVRDAATMQPVERLGLPASRYGPGAMHVSAVHFVDHDRALLLDGEDISLWHRRRKVFSRQLPAELLAFDPGGAWLVARDFEATPVFAHDLRRDEAVARLELTAPTAFAASPDGRQLAVGDARGAIAIYDTATWTIAATWAAHQGAVTALAWRGDGAVLASGSSGGVTRIWRDGEELAAIALGVGEVPWMGWGAPDDSWRDWLVWFADGSVAGPAAGLAHLSMSVGATPLGRGIAVPPTATDGAWSAVFAPPP